MNFEISIGSSTSNRITGTTTVAAAVADIQNGKWGVEVAAVRAAVREYQDIPASAGDEVFEAADKKIKELKARLPGFLCAGIFNLRKKESIVTFSGLLCADIDDVAYRIDELLNIARNDLHVVAVFVSPSGTGIKIIFRVPIVNSASEHLQNFITVRNHVASVYNAQVDEAAKDVPRLCYASHDPDAYLNGDAVPLIVEEAPATSATATEPQPSNDTSGVKQGGRNNAAFKLACERRDLGHTQDEVREAVREFAEKCSPPLPLDEVDACVKSAFTRDARSYKPGSTADSYLGGEGASRPAAALPELIDAAAFIAAPIAPPPELVGGMLHRGSKLVLGGGSKSFKTWCLLALAIAVAFGKEWLGHPTTPGKVLFLNFEIQPHAWQQRILAVARAMGATIEPGQITLWNLRGHAADFRQLIPKIIERCRTENFALIVLDPIYKIYGNTDENSAGNVALLLNALERLATETGAAIAFGAHFAKGNAAGKEAIDRISGSGVFARDPDSLLIFTKHETVNAFTVEPILRNFAPVDPFVVRWEFPLMHRDEELDPHRLKQVGGRPAKHSEDDLLALLPPDGLLTREWLLAAEAKNISERTFYRLRYKLENSGKVLGSVAGGRWTPSSTKTTA